EKLKSRGNSVLVVEHDEETMRRADYIIDLGPGPGVHGGKVIAAGTLAELLRHPESVTGKCLGAIKKYPSRGKRRPVNGGTQRSTPSPGLRLHGATRNNLKNLTVRFPLGRLVTITGVSGSGKSTLIRDCLLPTLEAALKRKGNTASGPNEAVLTGFETIQSVYEVDQSPIARTQRSIPATYVGVFDSIR